MSRGDAGCRDVARELGRTSVRQAHHAAGRVGDIPRGRHYARSRRVLGDLAEAPHRTVQPQLRQGAGRKWRKHQKRWERRYMGTELLQGTELVARDGRGGHHDQCWCTRTMGQDSLGR